MNPESLGYAKELINPILSFIPTPCETGVYFLAYGANEIAFFAISKTTYCNSKNGPAKLPDLRFGAP